MSPETPASVRGRRRPAKYLLANTFACNPTRTTAGDEPVFRYESSPTLFATHVEDRLSGVHNLPSSLQVGLLIMAHDPNLPDKSREVALNNLLSWYQRPVAPARWPAVLRAVLARAAWINADPHDVLMDSVRTALALVQPFFADPGRSFEAHLRQLVNDHVTEDFLGPGWRRDYAPLEDADREPAKLRFDEQILGDQYSFQLITLARLSPAQSEVIAAVTAGYEVWEIAADTGRAESTVRNLLAGARAKLKRARELVA